MDELTIRAAAPDDRQAVLALMVDSLGWADDRRHADLFAWKHDANPFGPSWAWVAEHPRDGIVGFRTFMRWRFEREGRTVEAVRAVDTATAASHRGLGIFSRLTQHGLAEVTAAGVDFVFNTPNDQSRPGYVKLGWQEVGRLPVQLRPRTPRSAVRTARSRVAAELWSEGCDAGVPAAEALVDTAAVSALLSSQPSSGALRTAATPDVLRWRFGDFLPLGYRAVMGSSGASGGLAIFRVRRRGRALECALAIVLAPHGSQTIRSDLARRALSASGADHAIALRDTESNLRGFVAAARLGPILTWRSAAAPPPAPSLAAWDLTLGDVELF